MLSHHKKWININNNYYESRQKLFPFKLICRENPYFHQEPSSVFNNNNPSMSSTPLWSWNMAATILWTMVSSRVSSGLCLVLLCGVCYWNSLPGDLVHDDIFAIKDNADVRPDTPLSTLVTNDFWGKPMSDPTSHKSYRPLCVLTFRLNYMLHGLEPWGYHAFNVLLHTLCTLLFWCLCRCVVFRSNIVGTDSSLLSWQAAALFAVHPIHTEAVS